MPALKKSTAKKKAAQGARQPPTGGDRSAESIAAHTSEQAAPPEEASLPRTPNWDVWRKRKSGTISELVKLTLNVSTAKRALTELREVDDPRIKIYQTHLNSATKFARTEEPGFVSAGPKDAPVSKQEFSLADYIVWLREDTRFSGVTPPAELLAMSPDRPASLKRRESPQGSRTDSHAKAAETNSRNSLLKLLLGMAVAGYDYQRGLKKRGGNKQALESLVAALLAVGCKVDQGTVKKRLEEADQVCDDKRWPNDEI